MADKDKGKGQTSQDAPQDATPAQDAGKGKTWSALAVARHASITLGRDVSDKRVRSVARDVLARYVAAESGGERAGYTAHRYTLAEVQTLMAALAGKGRGTATGTVDELAEALAVTGQDGDQ